MSWEREQNKMLQADRHRHHPQNGHLHQSPAGCTCSSRPPPLTHGTSPGPVGPPHLGSCPDAFSCNRSPGDGPPASSGGAEV